MVVILVIILVLLTINYNSSLIPLLIIYLYYLSLSFYYNMKIIIALSLLIYALTYFNNDTVELQPIYVDDNSNTKCVITGKYNHLCRTNHVDRDSYDRYNKYYKCYKKAKCVYENGRCRWKKTRKYNRCIHKIRRAFTNYYFDDYYYY